jgi:putative oxidoreductase
MRSAARAIWQFLNHRIVLRVIGLGIGGMFIYASCDKIIHPDRFADIVNDYQMLPLIFINAFGLAMPWTEFTAGLALVLGFWRRAAGLVLAALTLAFIIAVAQAQIRGLDIVCGCFDVSGVSGKASWEHFALDIGLLLACALVWRRA